MIFETNRYNYYSWYRIDKNISWFNIISFVGGLMYGLLTLNIFKKKYKYLLHHGIFWLPPKQKEIYNYCESPHLFKRYGRIWYTTRTKAEENRHPPDTIVYDNSFGAYYIEQKKESM